MRRRSKAVICTIACAGIAAIAATAHGEVVPRSEFVVGGLTFPVVATHAPGDESRLYIAEKPGLIRIVNLETGKMNASPFIDLTGAVWNGQEWQSESGFHGLAFHPDFATNGFFYVCYGSDPPGSTLIDRFAAFDPDVANPGSRVPILSVPNPTVSHNGGWIGFGPNDGYLYIASGDGECCGDPGNRAQDIVDELRGKMLRIDVDASGKGNYGIPADNPFVGVEGDDEIWAYGLRNPWRCSFDRATGDFYIADVGEGEWEEVNYQPAASPGGQNYGWRCREGWRDYIFDAECATLTLTPPVLAYSHAAGRAIIGGYVYRGCDAPELDGNYFFADNRLHRIWSFDDPNDIRVAERTNQISPSVGGLPVNQISSFGEDARGEMYIVDQGLGTDGQIFRIIGCERADFDCSGDIGFADVLRVLSTWGPCDDCLEDIDGDGAVGFGDVLELLTRWG